MEIYARPRQMGKTADLIRLAAEEFLYIVCPDRAQVRHIQGMAEEMGLDIPFPLTWDEFTSGQYHGRGINGFVIDNLDHCIQRMTTVAVRAVSLTTSEVPAEAG